MSSHPVIIDALTPITQTQTALSPPLLAHFAMMWGGPAIAVAIATSGQALAGVVGPLIEVPVLVGLDQPPNPPIADQVPDEGPTYAGDTITDNTVPTSTT